MTEEGRQMLITVEGKKLRLYRDIGGKWSIGIGHLVTPEELASHKFDDGITDEQAFAILEADLTPAAAAVKRYVSVPLSPFQFDALTSFAFNEGAQRLKASTLVKQLNAGDYRSVPAELRKWVYCEGQKSQGLNNRREAEIQLWSLPAKEGHAQ